MQACLVIVSVLRSDARDELGGRMISTTSGAGLFGTVGQANYGAARAAIVALTTITVPAQAARRPAQAQRQIEASRAGQPGER